MGWGRLDDGFDDHPKVIALLDEEDLTAAGVAIGLWTLCLSWAHRTTRRRGKTPGLLPAGLPRRFLGPAAKASAELLVKHRLWHEVEGGGWMIHDFADYLPTEETRAARSEAGKRGAAKRWGKREGETSGEPAGDDGNLPQGDGNLPSGCHDADGNAEANDGSRGRARRAISKEIAPIPTPTPVPPSAGADAPAAQQSPLNGMPEPPLTDTQRSKRITDAYAEVEPMCKWPAVNGVVLKAIKSNRFTDDEIRDAVLRLAKEGRSVTIETLRVELVGLPPRDSPPSVVARNHQPRQQSTTVQRAQAAFDIAAELDAEQAAAARGGAP